MVSDLTYIPNDLVMLTYIVKESPLNIDKWIRKEETHNTWWFLMS